MTKKPKTLFLDDKDTEEFEKYCLKKFKTKRVLSKIITEAMFDYMENNP